MSKSFTRNSNFVYCECKQNSTIQNFVTLSIVDQLKLIINRENIFELLKYRFDRKRINEFAIEELFDGKLYHNSFVKEFLSNQNNVSFTWYTDGVQVFKSSKTSIWPIYLRINELPYKFRIRKENTILAGLWYGVEKPSPNLFFSSLRPELELLYRGVSINFCNKDSQSILIRAIILCGTCDLPAKSLFLNINQFNGKYGCPSCEHSSTRVELSSSKSINVFTYTDSYVLRSLNQSKVYAEQALANRVSKRTANQKTSVMGIKGPCVLSHFMPDYIEGTAIDVMHAVFEGVAKKNF